MALSEGFEPTYTLRASGLTARRSGQLSYERWSKRWDSNPHDSLRPGQVAYQLAHSSMVPGGMTLAEMNLERVVYSLWGPWHPSIASHSVTMAYRSLVTWLVLPVGFEPTVSEMKTRRPGPLDDGSW